MNALTGLSTAEAVRKIGIEGYNELPSSKPRTGLAIVLEVLREPMFLLLIACGVIYIVLGDLREAAIMLSFVFIVIGITFYQESKSEHALEALRDLSSPRALVIRDGKQQRITGRDVVSDDILILAEGDRVPADAVLLQCLNLSVDESLLTGESVPVRKAKWDNAAPFSRPGGEDLPFVFSGTLVVKGQGVAQAKATGIHSEMGKIGKALSSIGAEQTPLQKETGRLVRQLTIFAAALCAIVIVVYGLTRGNWLDGVLAGITQAMAMLPEEFPVVLTVTLALGAWRISQKRVLTRRVPAIETLGSVSVLCVDKTGTLTENRMAVAKLFAQGQSSSISSTASTQPLAEPFHEIVEFSILASHRDPFDPMEIALKDFGKRYLGNTEHLHNDWSLLREYPLSPELLALSEVWRSPGGGDYVIATKGAPEAIADLCHFDQAQRHDLDQRVSDMANEGLRVLGIAKARFATGAGQSDLPGEQHDFKFDFIGLVGLADPIRQTVPLAVKQCYKAGIRVVMITGDYPGTAQSIGRQIGLKSLQAVITGPELDALSDTELSQRIGGVDIFARVVPEQKLRLVNALKANGEIVAMTGDGVNDAPALKAAHIGMAMGGRGTDVAREAAALVLLDDDFSSIVEAVKLGRRIFDNLRKAMAYIFSVHVPIAALSLVPVLLGWPLILLPIHVVFLELIIDPVCAVVFEAEPDEADVMDRAPRNTIERLVDKRTLILSLLQGLGIAIITLVIYGFALSHGEGEANARALTFTTLVIANLGLILANRSASRSILATLRSPNAALWWVIGGATAFLALILMVPFLRDLFSLSALGIVDIGICVLGGGISILWFDWLKRVVKPLRAVIQRVAI